MRAIDLYSGIGGWSLGLRMAGIETVASYEWWDQANETHALNFGRVPLQADIRALPLDAFPSDVDIVVGSPPCTHFSFANRGGNGDIAEGMKDVYKFLEVVERIQPRFWAMENVPRVAGILERELSLGGSLERFGELVRVITIVDMADYGLPQRRRRMIAGDFPVELLLAYRDKERAPTLGEVICGLSTDPATDPVYGFAIERHDVRDNVLEASLTHEEVRLNREAKQQHPFYNVMSFPDSLEKTARTVTALCTRVSRESIVVRNDSGRLRRLTLRERATLQGFPITFQFAGRTYTDRLKMVGNAIPPVFVYFLGHSMLRTAPAEVPSPRKLEFTHELPASLPTEIKPRAPKRRYPESRRFRAVIPGLRFGSGVRFELVNKVREDGVSWQVDFYFGTSKSIQAIELSDELAARAKTLLPARSRVRVSVALQRLGQQLGAISPMSIHEAWIHRRGSVHPFNLVDRLGTTVSDLVELLEAPVDDDVRAFVIREAERVAHLSVSQAHRNKLGRHARAIFVGFIVGGWFNTDSGLCASRRGISEAV